MGLQPWTMATSWARTKHPAYTNQLYMHVNYGNSLRKNWACAYATTNSRNMSLSLTWYGDWLSSRHWTNLSKYCKIYFLCVVCMYNTCMGQKTHLRIRIMNARPNSDYIGTRSIISEWNGTRVVDVRMDWKLLIMVPIQLYNSRSWMYRNQSCACISTVLERNETRLVYLTSVSTYKFIPGLIIDSVIDNIFTWEFPCIFRLFEQSVTRWPVRN